MILKSNVRYISDNYISFIPLKNKKGDSESFSTKRGEEVMTLLWFYQFVLFFSADIENPTDSSTWERWYFFAEFSSLHVLCTVSSIHYTWVPHKRPLLLPSNTGPT